MELLLSANFKPKRTILLAYGFDEETFGYHGAGNLSALIHSRYGDDGLAVIVDEGATFEEAWGTVFAKPGAAEKGSTNVEITIRSPGGHSSIPRDHTSIGILSELIYLLESTQYPTRLYDENPYSTQLQCLPVDIKSGSRPKTHQNSPSSVDYYSTTDDTKNIL